MHVSTHAAHKHTHTHNTRTHTHTHTHTRALSHKLTLSLSPHPQSGYPCLALHGGKDQSDRECTIADFKAGVGNILIATSVAARGLDVRDLVLVSGRCRAWFW